MPVTRVEPTNKLFDPARTFRYTNAANTDLAKRFKAMQVKAKAEARAKGQTELDARQHRFEQQLHRVLRWQFGRRGLLKRNVHHDTRRLRPRGKPAGKIAGE